VVYQQEAETSRASCRSIPEFDITAALRRTPELMVRFGGHRAAAGFTVANEKLPALRQALLEAGSEQLADVELAPALDIDAEIRLRHLNGRLIEWFRRLAPFGCANPEPMFLSRDVEVLDAWNMGEDGSHLRLKLRDGRVTYPAVAFHRGNGNGAPEAPGPDFPPPVVAGNRIDVVYTLTRDRGAEGALQLRLSDFELAAPA
jgi:single-stranded-DNA-specific exonuclease